MILWREEQRSERWHSGGVLSGRAAVGSESVRWFPLGLRMALRASPPELACGMRRPDCPGRTEGGPDPTHEASLGRGARPCCSQRVSVEKGRGEAGSLPGRAPGSDGSGGDDGRRAGDGAGVREELPRAVGVSGTRGPRSPREKTQTPRHRASSWRASLAPAPDSTFRPRSSLGGGVAPHTAPAPSRPRAPRRSSALASGLGDHLGAGAARRGGSSESGATSSAATGAGAPPSRRPGARQRP